MWTEATATMLTNSQVIMINLRRPQRVGQWRGRWRPLNNFWGVASDNYAIDYLARVFIGGNWDWLQVFASERTRRWAEEKVERWWRAPLMSSVLKYERGSFKTYCDLRRCHRLGVLIEFVSHVEAADGAHVGGSVSSLAAALIHLVIASFFFLARLPVCDTPLISSRRTRSRFDRIESDLVSSFSLGFISSSRFPFFFRCRRRL